MPTLDGGVPNNNIGSTPTTTTEASTSRRVPALDEGSDCNEIVVAYLRDFGASPDEIGDWARRMVPPE